MSGSDPYIDPVTGVLRNRFGLTDAASLEALERQYVTQRIAEGTPAGDFRLAHLQAIHRHLFQDVYEWAGQLRTVEIAKGGHQFQFCRFIETGMADVHRRLEAACFLKGLSATDFANGAAEILGDVNYVHPFREGNGRTQLCYLEQLAMQAAHPIDLLRLDRKQWVEASREAHMGEYRLMSKAIGLALITPEKVAVAGEAADAAAHKQREAERRAEAREAMEEVTKNMGLGTGGGGRDM